MSVDYENALSYLRASSYNNHNRSVYDHLCDIVLALLKIEKSNSQKDKFDSTQALASFEALSVSLKRSSAGIELNNNLFKEIDSKLVNNNDPQTISFLDSPAKDLLYQKLFKLFNQTLNNIQTNQTKILSNKIINPNILPDFNAQAESLSLAGVGINPLQVFEFYLSTQKLILQHKLTDVRFFGIIFGTRSDYYILEAKPSSWPSAPPASFLSSTKIEPEGTGANSHVYYVANSTSIEPEGFTRLPPVLPVHIVSARAITHLFTGDLSAPVNGQWKWTEAEYLRATIARIAATTLISPKGYYMVEEAEDTGLEVMLEDPEYQGSPLSEMRTTDMWVHHRNPLLRNGRVNHYIEPPKENEDDEDFNEDEDNEDDNLDPDDFPEDENEIGDDEEEIVPLLSSLDGDEIPASLQKFYKNLPLWLFRLHGRADSNSSVVEVRSSTWPGATTVLTSNKEFINIYVGDGKKWTNGKKYSPPNAPKIQKEFVSRYNPEEDEEGLGDPHKEQVDPLPPSELPLERDDQGEEGDEEGDQDQDEDQDEDEDDDDQNREDDD